MKFLPPVAFSRNALTGAKRIQAALNPAPQRLNRREQSAFTLIEIALCLAIIGFALVAIIGVLPTGMGVQKDNREETIIDQDAALWMNTIRNGAQGADDLTNYVMGITNNWARYPSTNAPATQTDYDGYGRINSRVTSLTVPATFALDSGSNIIGLLSMPKLVPMGGTSFQSNYVVAYVHAISGSAVEKFPQTNPTIMDSAFSYRMIVENVPYVPVEQPAAGSPAARVLSMLQANSRDLRLTFRWPLLPVGTGNGRQTFRAFTGGTTNISSFLNQSLYFFQPSSYTNS